MVQQDASSRRERFWNWVEESDRLDAVQEACATYALPMLVLNLLFYGLITTPIFAVMLMGAVLIHEGGHYAVLQRYGYDPKLYMFPVLGAGVSEPYRGDEVPDLSPVKKRNVFLAGPTVSTGFTALSGVAFVATGQAAFLVYTLVFAANDFFNLLPFWKVDGGRARAAVSEISTRQAAYTVVWQGSLFAVNAGIIAALVITSDVTLGLLLDGLVY